MKTTFIALLLAVAPGLAFAAGCSDHSDTAMSCAEGSQLDAETGTCVPTVTG